MSRVVSGKMILERRRVDARALVEAADAGAARPGAAAKGVELEAECQGAAEVDADPERLQQVLWNLLSNAVKFTPPGGRVVARARAEGGLVDILVEDDGCGIAPEFLPHVFDRFRQADASTTRAHGGLGIGLALVRELVELHGGSVEARSDGLGRGACVGARLPAAPAEEREPAKLRAEPPRAGAVEGADLRGATVLVVDDDVDARELMALALRERGARIELADGAEEALAALRGGAVDVMVSDIGMPGIDGYELIRRVRALPRLGAASLACVAVTAFTREQDAIRALREGFDRFLPKPVDAALLAERIAELRRSAERPA